jgi:hypothetical protein
MGLFGPSRKALAALDKHESLISKLLSLSRELLTVAGQQDIYQSPVYDKFVDYYRRYHNHVKYLNGNFLEELEKHTTTVYRLDQLQQPENHLHELLWRIEQMDILPDGNK